MSKGKSCGLERPRGPVLLSLLPYLFPLQMSVYWYLRLQTKERTVPVPWEKHRATANNDPTGHVDRPLGLGRNETG